jgi:hypothetical protein
LYSLITDPSKTNVYIRGFVKPNGGEVDLTGSAFTISLSGLSSSQYNMKLKNHNDEQKYSYSDYVEISNFKYQTIESIAVTLTNELNTENVDLGAYEISDIT